jgi:hypothetical protein
LPADHFSKSQLLGDIQRHGLSFVGHLLQVGNADIQIVCDALEVLSTDAPAKFFNNWLGGGFIKFFHGFILAGTAREP